MITGLRETRVDGSNVYLFRVGWQYGPNFIKQVRHHLALGFGLACKDGTLHGYSAAFVKKSNHEVDDNLVARFVAAGADAARFEIQDVDAKVVQKSQQRLPSTWNNALVVIGLRQANAQELIPALQPEFDIAKAESGGEGGGCKPCQRRQEWHNAVGRMKKLLVESPPHVRREILRRLGLSKIMLAAKNPQGRGVMISVTGEDQSSSVASAPVTSSP